MSAARMVVNRIECDAPGCYEMEEDALAVPQLRKAIRQEGWSRRDGKDYCPAHLRDLDRGATEMAEHTYKPIENVDYNWYEREARDLRAHRMVLVIRAGQLLGDLVAVGRKLHEDQDALLRVARAAQKTDIITAYGGEQVACNFSALKAALTALPDHLKARLEEEGT